MSTIESYGTSGSAPKGSRENPYTYEEYERRNREGKWTSAYVEGMGIVIADVDVTSSFLSTGVLSYFEDDYDDDYDPFEDPFDTEEDEQEGNANTNTTSGGNGSTGGGNGSTGSGGGNGGSSNSNQQVQDAASCLEFTKGFTADMINLFNKYRVKVSFFNGGKNSHYDKGKNVINMNNNNITLMSRVHEAVHSFQYHVLQNQMKHLDLVNIEYQAYAVSALYAIGENEISHLDRKEWGWLSGYVKNMEDGTFAVNSDIFQKLDGYARIWYENSSAALEYNNTKGVIEVKEDGTKIKGFPEWKNNYNYKWSELFNALGLEVR